MDKQTYICGLFKFLCDDHECIPTNHKCDGKIDCSDGSDENNCREYKYLKGF